MRQKLAGGADDRGSMTVMVLGVIAGALVLAVLVGGLVRGVTARGQAQAAADLAALAAGEVAAGGGDAPSETGRRDAERNGAALVSCQFSNGGMDILATIATDIPLPRRQQTRTATSRNSPDRPASMH